MAAGTGVKLFLKDGEVEIAGKLSLLRPTLSYLGFRVE